MKAYKSLEAYNFFVCGHVQDVYCNIVKEDVQFCFVKSKVLPSQRQGQKTKLYDVWVALNKVDGWILTGNCTCMAGLGSVCSHVAALLFKLEACVRIQANKVAVTSKLCVWNRSRKKAEPSMLQNINFKRPMKNQLPFSTQNIKNPKRNYSFSENVVKFSNNSLHKLRAIAPEAAFFTSVVGLAPTTIFDHSFSDNTATADENDTNFLPEPITSLFDNDANNLDKSLLEEFCLSKFNEYKNSYSQCNFNLLAEVSKTQNLSNTWKLHRAGRITASNFHEVINKKLQNSKPLLFKIMNYVISPNVASVIYGREMEDKARCFYIKLLKKNHNNFKLETTGIHIQASYPYLGASPDGIIQCTCHNKGLVEIKCPYKYREGLNGWKEDKDFPVCENGDLKTSHKYYTQIQGQMMILDVEVCDFFIWTPLESEGNYLLVRVYRDEKFINEIKQALHKYYFTYILPETVTRENDIYYSNKQKNYCICKRPCFKPMIACNKPSCEIEWFHYSCVNVTRAPKGIWICPNCLK
ncbi:uncharacterized protein LOC124815619 [Hydra vulgaris]|uniref:uncharacterized protein LOC124815619 n=1 Tax=Hydra vulgaris TaxID=6087 RepID=UPI001F5ED129|nr:uncharacterized protein LOC124815619 [Hydra vulgaris]